MKAELSGGRLATGVRQLLPGRLWPHTKSRVLLASLGFVWMPDGIASVSCTACNLGSILHINVFAVSLILTYPKLFLAQKAEAQAVCGKSSW